MAKTYVIADIHGRADLLLKASELIIADIAEDNGGTVPKIMPTIIVLGDFIDRGPASAKVIAMLRMLNESVGWRVLRGNHEEMMMEVLANPTPRNMKWWFGNGGNATMVSYGYKDGDQFTIKPELASDLEWLATLPVWIADKHRIYVHAGVPFDKPVNECKDETLQWMLYGGHNDDPQEWEDFPHCSGKHIVHGHHQHHMNPHRHLVHRTNLDSFACYSNRLAVGVFDDDVAGGPVRVLDAINILK